MGETCFGNPQVYFPPCVQFASDFDHSQHFLLEQRKVLMKFSEFLDDLVQFRMNDVTLTF